jgi:hypothetical protein
MREECKNFESRTYANGDTVRQCGLDLAPEAPWRCPPDCPAYERRLVDVDWQHGTLIAPPTPPEPPGLERGDDVARLLDEAEDIINAAGPRMVAEVSVEHERAASPRWRRLFRRGA